MTTSVEVSKAAERFARDVEPFPGYERVRTFVDADIEPMPVMQIPDDAVVLDLARGSDDLGEPTAGVSVERLTELIERRLQSDGTTIGLGRWGECRDLYANDLFAADDTATRDVHLGVDVFGASGLPVFAPLDGRVHLLANNARELDYGPLVILQHETPEGLAFYSLYGHLAASSTRDLKVGESVKAGEQIAAVGSPPENGNWPPHLHFQLILDLLGLGADFPGVSAKEEPIWMALSPLPRRFFPVHSAQLDAS